MVAPSAVAQTGGEAIFKKNCQNCHAPDLSGKTAFANATNSFGHKPNIPDLRSAAVQSQTDDMLLDSIGRGTGHHDYPHAFMLRGYTRDQILSVIAYIRSQKK